MVVDSIKEGNIIYIKGNLLRFVNDYKYHNVEVLTLPYKKMWRTYYLAKHFIK